MYIVGLNQPMEVQEEEAAHVTCLVPLRTLMGIDNGVSPHIPPIKTSSLMLPTEFFKNGITTGNERKVQVMNRSSDRDTV